VAAGFRDLSFLLTENLRDEKKREKKDMKE